MKPSRRKSGKGFNSPRGRRPLTDPGLNKRGRRLRKGSNRRVRPPSLEIPTLKKEEPRPGVARRVAGAIGSGITNLWNRPSGRRAKQPVFLRVAVGIAMISALAYGGYRLYRFVMASPHFRVHKVVITPTVHVTAGELRKLSKLTKKDNIFEVDLKKVAQRVKEHPWVQRAVATRRLPNTIHIKVTEQKPAAAVLMDRLYLANLKGEAFKQAEAKEPLALPVITGISRRDYQRSPVRSQKNIRTALQLLKLYTRRRGRPSVGEIHLDPDESITLYTRKKAIQIRLGKKNLEEKLLRLDAVLTALGKRALRLQTVRLDNNVRPERVTVRLAASGPELQVTSTLK